MRGTQKTIWTDKVDYEPWLTFFITSLQKQKRLLESKIQKLHNSNEDRLPTTAREILDLFINKSELDMAEIIQLTGKKSETVRKSVQGLVKKGFLVKQGTTKGVSYTFNKD